ncbi:hypothetical protein AB6809_29965 [Paraburkholderia sp. RCC_158]|uniref:hypothetical protein n=1 Tax=Paraburkholderia sp. RCC_158 TaxID=3239220 RepID=UPI003523385F
MNPLSQFGVLAIIAALAFGGGFYTERQFNQAHEVKAEQKVVTTAATDVQAAQVTSQKLEASTAAVAVAVDQNKSVIHQRVVTQMSAQMKRQAPVAVAQAAATSTSTETHDETNQPDGAACNGFALDVGTVRMLNASRAGVAFHPAGVSNDPGEAAPALCFADFIDADQELTKLYLDLAARHDALVDSVEHFQSEQRERLGIKDAPASGAAQ